MNRLIAIWCEKGLPLNFNPEEYESTILNLQQKLDGIYEAFTGDCGHAEISQVEMDFISKNTHDVEIVDEFEFVELVEENNTSNNSQNQRLSRAPPSCLFS